MTCAVKDFENKYRKIGKKIMIVCPCHDCNKLKMFPSIETVQDPLFCHDFKQSYTKWVWNGEELHCKRTSSGKYGSEGDSMNDNNEDDVNIDRMEEMVQDVEDHFIHKSDILNSLVDDSM